ncbi:MAG: HEAT repeat domain-containing protein, partial [Acidobacteria bacterium]|nr:HEAT repeat domain-containing protein [Acidobacteriota bacterium]
IADKADYYLIRTLDQQGKRSEALVRIDAFPKVYPRSQWQTDVEEMRVRLTNQVSPAALRAILPPPPPPPPPAPPSPPSPFRIQTERILETAERAAESASRVLERVERGQTESADPEVSLQQEIMRAVFRNNPDRGIEIVTERLKANPADPLVMSSLNMVATSRSAQALPVLLAIAKNGTNARARRDAIYWISQSRAEKDTIVDTLVGLLPSLGDDEAESVAFALGQTRTEKATNALAAIARDKSKSEKNRNNALFWIGQSRVANRITLLEDIYKSSMDSSTTRRQVLFALSRIREPQVAQILGNIASTDPDIEVRKQAVFWLGQIRGPEANQALERLLQKK